MLISALVQTSDSPVDDLEKECSSIASDYEREGPSKQANIRLARAVYELALRCMEQDLIEDALYLARSNAKRSWLAIESNPFQIVLSAVFHGQGPKISSSTFERVWKQLWHAFRHFVPPPFLEGFLLQCRAKDICIRAMEPEIELGCREWVTCQLGIYLSRDGDGYEFEYPWIVSYPLDIYADADAIRAELDEDDAECVKDTSSDGGDDDDEELDGDDDYEEDDA